jgi:hypothetical protein
MPPKFECAARRPTRPADTGSSWARPANTVKALVITDPDGRLLFCGQTRPGAIHDLTQTRQAGLVELLARTPGVTLLTDAGYQGLSAQTAGAVITPRPARLRNQLPVPPALAAAHEAERRTHATKRIRVERGISHLKNWRVLSRHLGRREHLDTILPAVAGLVSSQERAPTTRPAPRPTESSPGRHHQVIEPAVNRQRPPAANHARGRYFRSPCSWAAPPASDGVSITDSGARR